MQSTALLKRGSRYIGIADCAELLGISSACVKFANIGLMLLLEDFESEGSSCISHEIYII